MQIAQVVHAVVAVLFVAVILAHIYIGTLGMEGAFEAMGTGEVDLNWAKEHHDLWLEDKLAKERARPVGLDRPRPASRRMSIAPAAQPPSLFSAALLCIALAQIIVGRSHGCARRSHRDRIPSPRRRRRGSRRTF